MGRLAVCKKCGDIYELMAHTPPKQKCYMCDSVGTFIPLDITWDEAKEKYDPELLPRCKKMALEKYGNEKLYSNSWLVDMRNERIREDYFYGKLDQHADSYKVNKRIERIKYSYTKEAYDECERVEAAVKALKGQKFQKCPSCGSFNVSMKITLKGTLQLYFHRAGYTGFDRKYICRDCGERF